MIKDWKLSARWMRILVNFWPCIRGCGGRVTYISEDFTRLQVKLPLSWRTRNVVGTIYGGSMYGSTDPFFMLMLMRILGPDFVVWDKGCALRFKRPAKETIFADFHITPEMMREAREKVAKDGEATFTWTIAYKNSKGVVYVEFDKTMYVATKAHYKQKMKMKASLVDEAL